MSQIDPIDNLVSSTKMAAEHNFAFYSDKIDGIIRAYFIAKLRYPPDQLRMLIVKGFMESGNTQEDLAYMLTVALSRLTP